MSQPLAEQAGHALFWKIAQFGTTRGLSFIRSIVLARILVPDDFGVLAIAAVIIEVAMAITDLGMVAALLQRRQVDDRHYDTVWTTGVLRGVVVGVVLVATAGPLASVFGDASAAPVLRVLALRPLLEALASPKVVELQRDLRFRALAAIALPAVVADVAVAVTLAPHVGLWAVVVAALVSTGVETSLSYGVAPHRPRLTIRADIGRELFAYGRWVFLAALARVSGAALLRAVVARRLGASALGLYFLAANLAFLPLNTTSAVLWEVAFPLHAQLQDDLRRARRAFRAVLTAMSALLLPFYAVLAVLAEPLVDHVLGPKWSGAVDLIRLFAIGGAVGSLAQATMPMLEGLGHARQVFVLDAVRSGTLAVGAWALARTHGLAGAAVAWLLADITLQVTAARYARRALGRPFAGVGSPLTAILLASGLAALVAGLVDNALDGLAGLTAATLCGGGTAVVALWQFDRRSGRSLSTDLTVALPALAARLPFLREASSPTGSEL